MKKTTLLLGVCASMISGGMMAQTQKIKPHQHVETAQTQRTCGTNEHHEFLKQTRPGYEKDLADYNKMIAEYLKKNESATQKTTATVTIPVVVHILYQNATENISDLRATEQVTVLNEDFTKTNADTTIIPSIFKPDAAGTDINFCLAQRDPNGNPTTGIIHKSTTVATFSTNDACKSSASGGDDAWDVSRYVNIWVCDLGTSLLGYGEFPTGSLSNTYGLVLNYRYTGKTGAQAPFNLGRTGTHEFGHCFNLYHIWGDDGTACTGSDQVSDTPNQKGENYGNPTFPQGTSASGGCCNAADQSSMYMNYMDYTDDDGMVMFTAGQITRIEAVVNNPPYNVLQSSDGCTPVNLVANDASVFAISSPTGSACSPSITPTITLKNMGSTTLTSCDINYQVDGGTAVPFAWTGNLASLATTAVTLPTSTTTSGTHTITVTTSNPNGTTDGDPSNDSDNNTFTIVAGSGQPMPFSEGFEGTTFIPTGWQLNNSDAGDTWERNTGAAKTGVASASIDNYTNDFTGQKDDMVSPAIDLTSQNTPQLTFQVAYKLYTDPSTSPNYADTLEVLISTDCGATWSSLYKKFGTALTTATPTFQTNIFTPTANQWRMETVPLTSYSSINNAYFMFRNISQYENRLWIDDINIQGTVGIKDQDAKGVSVNVYPNPNNGEFYINVVNANYDNSSEVIIYNMLGEKVAYNIMLKGPNVTHPVSMNNLASGVYQIEVKTNGTSTFNKIVINK